MLPYGIDPDIADLSKRLANSSYATQGVLAIVILLLLLCLIILYCCWGACNNWVQNRTLATNLGENFASPVMGLPYGGVVCIESSSDTEIEPPRNVSLDQANKEQHQCPPSYETLFGPATSVPPSYSSLNLEQNTCLSDGRESERPNVKDDQRAAVQAPVPSVSFIIA